MIQLLLKDPTLDIAVLGTKPLIQEPNPSIGQTTVESVTS